MKIFLRFWLPVLAWLCLIFVGSTDVMSAEQTSRFVVPFLHWLKPNITPETVAQIHFAIRKLGHVSEYAVLASLLLRAVYRGTRLRWDSSVILLFVWFAATLFAGTDEFHQSFIPSRTAAFGDVMIDSAGAVLGTLLAWLWCRGRPKTSAAQNDGGPERI